MRNGNRDTHGFSIEDIARSYRTYEEWKPRDLHKVLNHELFVLTVPMRNGNNMQDAEGKAMVNAFLPYL